VGIVVYQLNLATCALITVAITKKNFAHASELLLLMAQSRSTANFILVCSVWNWAVLSRSVRMLPATHASIILAVRKSMLTVVNVFGLLLMMVYIAMTMFAPKQKHLSRALV
jgi:hypothetical protein